jgi:hypothetical protein
VADADRAAYRDYITAQETARLEKLKSAQVVPFPSPLPI